MTNDHPPPPPSISSSSSISSLQQTSKPLLFYYKSTSHQKSGHSILSLSIFLFWFFFFWIPHIKELVTLFINIFKILFYEYMLGNRSTSFMNILLIVKRVEWAIKDKRINKIVKHKKWRNVYKKEVKVHHVHGWSHLLAKRL